MSKFSLVWICNDCDAEFGRWNMARKHARTCIPKVALREESK